MSKSGRKREDLSGLKFGKLVANEYNPKKRVWACTCECGGASLVKATNLKNSTVKSCGCIQHARRTDSSLRKLWRRYKFNSKNQERDFELSVEELNFITSQNCVYCGVVPSQRISSYPTSAPYIHNGIDRQDNSVGYVLSNCVPCCKVCNYMKRELASKEFIEHVKRISEHQNESIASKHHQLDGPVYSV